MLVLLLFSMPPNITLLIISSMSISIGYSLTNKRKTAIFDDFRLIWAFFGHFLLSSPKLLNIIDSYLQGI